MKIIDQLRGDTMGLSCELFPPKEGGQLANALDIVHQIAKREVDFISVTYGAGGSAVGKSVAIAAEVEQSGVPAMAHLTCVNATEASLERPWTNCRPGGSATSWPSAGPAGRHGAGTYGIPPCQRLGQKIKSYGDFCVGGACYPEGHPESAGLDDDIEKLKYKVDNGVDFLVTQMFFDNAILYNYMYRLLAHGINVPVVPGIMPVTNARQITRICQLSGTKLPLHFRAIVERFADDPEAMKQAGINYATTQALDLLANGFKDVHIYTMNKPEVIGGMLDNLSHIVRRGKVTS